MESQLKGKEHSGAIEKKVGGTNTLIETGKINVFDPKGNIHSSVTLPKKIFAVKVNPQLIAQAIRVYLVNQRQGTVRTLSRGEVDGSTRKIYRQKGTGRARHGGIRAPIFVKGGVAHGPKPKEYVLSMSKQMKRAALCSALSAKFKNGELIIVTGLETVEIKTKEFARVLSQWGITAKKQRTLCVLPGEMREVYRGMRNLPGISVISVQRLTTYDVLKHQKIVFANDAIFALEKLWGVKDVE